MLFDAHIHIDNFAEPQPIRLLKDMDAYGVDKLALFAEEPAYHEKDRHALAAHNAQRLERLMQWCRISQDRLVPVYFLNPIEIDAMIQIDRAVDAGVAGFKVICETFYPGDVRAMPVYQYIADLGKPILFHSGILWDYGDNGNYNRPCNWECMFAIENLRFALAHVSWPWCDEAIALFGKFCSMETHPRYRNQKMYIDMCPGTPDCYRKHVIQTLHDVGYDHMDERLLFGSDSFTNQFRAADVKALADSDHVLLREAGFDEASCARILGENAQAFWLG